MGHVCLEEFEDFQHGRIRNFTNECEWRITNANFKLPFQIPIISFIF